MEITIIADVHANLPALEAVLAETQGLEVFCCGDLVGYTAFPNETVELIRNLGIKCIMGNHDYAVATGDFTRLNDSAKKAAIWTAKVLSEDNLKFLANLPKSYVGTRFTAFHGSPRDPLFDYIFQNVSDEILSSFLGTASTLILGHTHLSFIRKIGGKIIFNPGSVGQPRDRDPRASYAILDTKDNEAVIKRASYDIDSVVKEIRRHKLPVEFAKRLLQGN